MQIFLLRHHHFLNIFHDALGDIVGSGFINAFGINADNRFGIGRAQMHPVLFKFDFQAIFGINGLFGVLLLNFFENILHIHPLIEFYFIFGNKIIGISAAQSFDRFSKFCQMG